MSFEILDNEAVVLTAQATGLHRLDAAATAVFLACPGLREHEIVERIAQDFSVAVDHVKRDVAQALENFLRLQLVCPQQTTPTTPPMQHREPVGTQDVRRRRPLGPDELGPYRAVAWFFTVRVASPGLRAEVERLLHPLQVPDRALLASDGYYELTPPKPNMRGHLRLNGEQVATHASEWFLYAMLIWHINRAVVHHSGDHVLLHAAAAVMDQRMVIMSGPQNAGKSTLVAGLVRAGWSYVTDEIVAIRPDDLEVTSYPKALSIDPGSWDALRDLEPVTPRTSRHLRKQWQVDPDSIRPGASRFITDARPALLIFPRYRAGSETQFRILTSAQALTRILSRLFAGDRDPDRDLSVLARLTRNCPAYDLEVGDLTAAISAVRHLIADSEPSARLAQDLVP